MTRQRNNKRSQGLVLVGVVCMGVVLVIVGLGVISLAHSENVITRQELNRLKAFYLAEAGLAQLRVKFSENDFSSIEPTSLGQGSFYVDYVDDGNGVYALATAQVGNMIERIQVEPTFLASVYEDAIYAGNGNEGPFTFTLRGTGNPTSNWGGEVGGRDIVNGDVFVNGDVRLYEDSQINEATSPNLYGLMGDVEATGSIDTLDDSSIAGTQIEGASLKDPPDLLGMDYANTNTYNINQVFDEVGTDAYGSLANTSHDLYDIFVKNPTNRSSECASTTGDDFFLQPSQINCDYNWRTGETPMDLGQDQVYYVDGDVWVHASPTYGFTVNGEVTIVATGDIHICDNIEYANEDSLLGLVALGTYNESGELVSGGNIYFGDPRFGTTYVVSALMFAAHDFLYNTDSVTRGMEEPESGFIVNGNFSALNEISIERDWYSKTTTTNRWPYQTTEARPAHYDTATDTWLDLETGEALTAQEIGSLRHYQMQVNYDDRVRSIDTQPPSLPQSSGSSGIFSGFSNWQEINSPLDT